MKFRIIASIVLVVIVIAAYALKVSMQESVNSGGSEPTSGFVP
jgi:hypothetical protein